MTSKNHIPADPDGLNLRAEYRRATVEVMDLGRRAGFRIVPYRDSSLPHFSRLSLEEQKKAVSFLQEFSHICRASLENGCDIKNTRQFLWFTIRRLGLKPPSEMFDHVAEGDIIAIHHGSQQLFRNLEYFDYCSYSLEELGCLDWTSLYERPVEMEKDIVSAVDQVYLTKKMVVSTVGEHIVQETFAPLRLKMGYRLKFVSPLFYKNSTSADHYLVCMQAELKEPAVTGAEEEELLKHYYRKQNLWQEQRQN
ncbi:MAG TPA: hypothetical protein PL182_02130 [Pseudobdellovibrionaceae bacterium]|nr:hypothetical protein [Pseudobdellovibrionaceae bacterium]